MNLYRIGFYRNEMPESVLVVLAENEEQAKSFWPVSAERPAVACCYDGAVSTPMVTPGVVLKQGRWDDYSHPGLVTNIKCEQGQELTWMRQDYLMETTFEYTPRKVTQ